ncbi:GIY-YIG nuclease family protein [Wenzhouxiangella limi]|uniref:GIY-YIG nuclease family protein n=1 Tax=Wenzhouxiangella limi TaxID=2707351 RepID=A0A845V4Z3_9GAMM|nr:GIY-YIG nuclease family protein [Wenzhouxiangella limi]
MKAEKRTIVGRYLIYGLLDPRDQSLRYIGKTHKRRELRLKEHIEEAKEGTHRPVHRWIQELLSEGHEPQIFIWRRISPEQDWGDAERAAIGYWRTFSDPLPYLHPPQTPKSQPVLIRSVDLTNIRGGG